VPIYGAELGEPYNLICMDIFMPEMGGQQAIKQIRVLVEAEGISPANEDVMKMLIKEGGKGVWQK